MLPAFVIGLREGLETVVIIGAIAVFLRARGRTDLLRRVWRASAVAAGLCTVIAFAIRFLEVNLPWRQQEQLETVVGLAAIAMVTYMVVWMRRFPKDLQRETNTAAESAIERNAGKALVALAFFAVLREGFEIAVFVLATVGSSASNAWLAAGGAVLGVLVALVAGVGIVRGSRRVDVARFFRATALILVLTAAGIAMTTVHTANAAGWITFGQTPQFDLAWLAPPGSVLSSFTTGMFGLQPYPVIIEVIAWFAYFVPMTVVVLWPGRAATRPSRSRASALAATPGHELPADRGRTLRIGVLIGCAALVAGGVVVAVERGHPQHPITHGAPARRVLYARLDAATCTSSNRCFAVGEFLPVDKDAASGDPDGDGQATHTLAESSDGSAWRLITSPDEGKGGAALSGISCPSSNACVAVGSYRPAKFPLQAKSAPPDYPLIESYNGRSWRIEPSPRVAPNSILVSVSCASISSCVAVGSTTTNLASASPVQSSFIEELRGGTWTEVPGPSPPDTDSGLSSVSCPSATSCVAIGNVAPRSDPAVTHPLIEVLVGGAWVLAALPSPVLGRGILYDVACESVGRCTAVGSTEAAHAAGSALVLTSDGSRWAVNAAAMDSKQANSLTTVACTTATSCVAAGTYLPSLIADPERVLARIDATSFRELARSTTQVNVAGIACAAEVRCLLVGSAPQGVFGYTQAWVAELSGGSWRTITSPVP